MSFRFLTAGESHGKALVTIIEGVPAGLPLTAEAINRQLVRRMQGYGRGARMKIEADAVEFLSGVRAGETLGSPIALQIALLVPLLAGILGFVASMRMVRLPDIKPSADLEGMAFG